MNLTSINGISSIVAYGVALCIGLAYTPFLIRELGVAAYGLIPLSFSLVQYFGLLTQTLSATINQRLVANRENSAKFDAIFSMALLICFLLAAAVTVLLVYISFFVEHLIKIPVGMVESTKWVFLAVSFSLGISIATTPYASIVFSYNSIYVLSIKQAVEALLRALIVVAAFVLFSASMQYVSFSIVASTICGAAILLVAGRHLRPQLRLTRKGVSWFAMRGMIRTGGGVGMIQVGTLLMISTDLFLVNFIYGPTVGGGYAAAAMWAVVLRGFALSVTSTVTARVMLDYHDKSAHLMIGSVTQNIRLLTAFASLPVGYIVGISPFLLSVWIGDDIAMYSTTLSILAIPVAINLAANPILAIALASDRTTDIGVCYVASGLVFLIGSLIVSNFLQWNGAEIAMLLAIILIGKNYIFIIPKVAKILGGDSKKQLVRASLYSVFWTIIVAIFVRLLGTWNAPNSYWSLLWIGIITIPFYLYLLRLTLPETDRELILKQCIGVSNKLSKLRKQRI